MGPAPPRQMALLYTGLARSGRVAHCSVTTARRLSKKTVASRPFRSRRGRLVSHYLIASLPIREAATTNYDTLFEDAWAAAAGHPWLSCLAKRRRRLTVGCSSCTATFATSDRGC